MRLVILVIDSFGIGAMPDAEQYGDAGANTALHICEALPGPKWANLKAWGLGNAAELLGNRLPGCEAVEVPAASCGVMREKSPGKDTTTGHWELAGIELSQPFTVLPSAYPSFPEKLSREFERRTGRKILGNKAASGTVIIEELGAEHMQTGNLICYTSGDSVFQIAAHEDIISVEQLYQYCEIARELCDAYQIGRVIARPFIGTPGAFTRTSRRRDFSIALPVPSVMEHLAERGVHTIGVGKIGDIFNEQGIAESFHDKGNPACLDRTEALLERPTEGDTFIFVNLVDTDMIYGHRRDIKGYRDAVQAVDDRLPAIVERLNTGDVAVITADHGCDPSFRGTDHTREHVPLLWYRKGSPAEPLGVRSQFSDLARAVTDYFDLEPYPRGRSLSEKLHTV